MPHGVRSARPLRDAGRRVVAFCARRILQRIDAQLCPPGQLPLHDIHRVLVLRPNHRLGNAVLLTPLLDALEATYPGAEIDVVSAGRAARTLFCARFQLHRVISLPGRIVGHPFVSMHCLRQLRGTRYDLAIDPCVASNSGHLLLGTCHARYKAGFASGAAPDAVRARAPGLPEHMAQLGVYALRKALGDTTRTQWPPLDLRLAPAELQQGLRALERIRDGDGCRGGRERPVLGVFAHATGNKRLPEAWWGALLRLLRDACPDVCIVEVLAAHGRSQLPGATASFYTRDLRKLAAVLANMHGFVSADCGVMHVAAAVGTPTLGLFLQGNRAKYEPYGNGNAGLDVALDDANDEARVAGVTHMSVMAWVQRLTDPAVDDSERVSTDCGPAAGPSA